MPGSSSWMPHAPQGVKRTDNDDNDNDHDDCTACKYRKECTALEKLKVHQLITYICFVIVF
jgi:hypothetical protein